MKVPPDPDRPWRLSKPYGDDKQFRTLPLAKTRIANDLDGLMERARRFDRASVPHIQTMIEQVEALTAERFDHDRTVTISGVIDVHYDTRYTARITKES